MSNVLAETSKATQRSQILVVDKDSVFVNQLKLDARLGEVDPLSIDCTGDAREFLVEESTPLRGVFISYDLPDLGWVEVVKAVHQSRPGTPTYLMYSGDAAPQDLTEKDLQNLGVQKSLGKPLDYKKMISLLNDLDLGFSTQIALQKAKENKDQVDGVSLATDDDFSPIRASNFLSGSQCLFDVYVRLKKDKFVMILHAGDVFDHDRLSNYIKKGVESFYIKKEIQETYVRYCEFLVRKILGNKEISKNIKLAQTLNFGEETSRYLKESGVGENELRMASNFVATVQDLFEQFKPKEEEILKEFVENIALYDHGVSTAMIAALLADSMGIESEYAVNIIGTAALVHDVGLLKLPEEIRHEDLAKMTPEETELFKTHPHLGAEELKKIPGMPPLVPTIVAQHHVRRGKLGFPSLASVGGTLNQNVEIVGIAGEFSRLISEAKDNLSLDPIGEMENAVFPGFSRGIVIEFQTVFSMKALF